MPTIEGWGGGTAPPIHSIKLTTGGGTGCIKGDGGTASITDDEEGG